MRQFIVRCTAASMAVAGVLLISMAHAQQFSQFEDDGSAQIFNGTSVHVCPGGAMFGVDAANNRFLCMTLVGLGPATVDTNTVQEFDILPFGVVHVCPAGSIMIGWHKGNNWLICASSTTFPTEPYTFPRPFGPRWPNPIYFTDTGSSAPEPAQPGSSMHICDQDRQHAVMVGIEESTNILICRSDRVPAPPFNLIVSDTDAAGFPLNPRWGANLEWKTSSLRYVPDPRYCLDHGFPDVRCRGTNPITFNRKLGEGWGGPSGAFCQPHYVGGHVNWRVVTYTGKLWWDEFSSSRPFKGDADYNFLLETEEGAGVDKGNSNRFNPTADYGALTLEFASYETVDMFGDWSWWSRFKKSVDENHAGLFGSPAIATGTLGLDCQYRECKAELHPVFALAVKIQPDPGPGVDVWAFFARNNGNEGSCSDHLETVSTPEFDFDVPWKAGARDVNVTKFFEQFPTFAGARLIVTPLPCENKLRIQIANAPLISTTQWISDGEVNLEWSPGVPPCFVSVPLMGGALIPFIPQTP